MRRFQVVTGRTEHFWILRQRRERGEGVLNQEYKEHLSSAEYWTDRAREQNEKDNVSDAIELLARAIERLRQAAEGLNPCP